MLLAQNADFLEDLNLEVLDDAGNHFRALVRVSDPTVVVVDWQLLVDVDHDVLGRITFQGWDSDLVEDGVLQALLGRMPEEGVVLEHVAQQLLHKGRASRELFLHVAIDATFFIRLHFLLVFKDVLVRDKR